MNARVVRDDQHGTTTGYVYGCRCRACSEAAREYRVEHAAGPETVEKVYDALEQEADMDGVVTATGERIGELVGVTSVTALRVIHLLDRSGRLTVTGRVGPRGRTLEVVLSDGAS